MRARVTRLGVGLTAAVMAACTVSAPSPTLSAADADRFLKQVNDDMLRLGARQQQADWVAQTYITPDTEAITARASREYAEAVAANAKEAAKFDHITVSPEARRQLNLLKVALVVVTPSKAADADEVTRLVARMNGAYGAGKWCADPDRPESCLDVGAITEVMATSHDPKRLREVWEGWRTIGPPLRNDYVRFVELANEGARELGFADSGSLWRSKYDMPPDDFGRELDRLWTEVRPLYVSLHAYVRMKLHEKYGGVVPANGPIPAHLLGNIWAQDWTNVYPLVAPKAADPGYSLTAILRQRRMTPLDMVRTGERFFTSLGLERLPDTFWQRSLFVKPADRNVVCHASAWDVDLVDDLRIKMCIEQTGEAFRTIHHELGHNFYQRAYNTQPALFRDSANDGFHEALGDTIALSVTPEYLVKIGLLDQAPDQSRDIGLLLTRALEKVAFLPFGLMVDQWRWQVFSGKITPDHYNEAWWALRQKYQGVAPPEPRGEAYFDPAAKYHVADAVPYARYFLADILQFQFHRALAHEAGCTAPLHRCSIYASAAAGTRLDAMMKMGLSRPWPDALESLTGSRQMDATAMLDYFAPLQKWLDAQTADAPKGW